MLLTRINGDILENGHTVFTILLEAHAPKLISEGKGYCFEIFVVLTQFIKLDVLNLQNQPVKLNISFALIDFASVKNTVLKMFNSN